MRIGLVTTFYPNAADPGRTVFVRNLVAALEQHAAITVIAPVPYAPPIPPRSRWRALRSIPRRENDPHPCILHPRFAAIPSCAPLNGLTYFLAVRRPLRGLKALEGIDLVNVHCAYPDAVGIALAASGLGVPYVVTAHGSDINVYGENRLYRWQIARALKGARAVIAVSGALQQRIAAIAPSIASRIVHIPCAGVDPCVFRVRERAQARAQLSLPEEGRLVLFAGQLVPVKSVDVLLEAWRILSVEGALAPGDRLIIAGEGPERGRLAALVSAAGLSQSVRLLGNITQQQLARWLNAATLLCLPSRNEGTPNVIIEALASGLPVVASRVGGVPEIVCEGESGLLVEPGEAAKLATALVAALSRVWNRKSITEAVANFTWDALAARHMAVFRRVVGNDADLAVRLNETAH